MTVLLNGLFVRLYSTILVASALEYVSVAGICQTQPIAANRIAPTSKQPNTSIETQPTQQAMNRRNAAQNTELPPVRDDPVVQAEEFEIVNQDNIRARNVIITAGEYTLTGGFLDGNFNKILTFTGHPTLTYRGQTLTGDAIRFQPKTKFYSVFNLHTALTPEFLKGRISSPLYVTSDEINGEQRQSILGTDAVATTCDLSRPHYFLKASEITVEPGRDIILKHAAFTLWGKRLFTLPTLVIPLNRPERQLRITHAPQVGRSVDEGWFAKSVFDYTLANRIPGLFRLDLMEKKGIGTGVDVDWKMLRSVGALTLYAIPTGGFSRNFTGRLDQRQNIGGGQTLTLNESYQNSSYLATSSSTNTSTRFGYSRAVKGFNTTLNLSDQSTDSTYYSNSSFAANFAQTMQFGTRLSMSMGADFSKYVSQSNSTTSTTGFQQITEQLATRFQADERASNYALQIVANKNVPIGGGTGNSYFSGVEKLPEVSLNNYRFTSGFLSTLPTSFGISAGKYTEGGSSYMGSTSQMTTERAVATLDISQTRFELTKSTDLLVSGGFQQFFYGEGSAQYVIRDSTTLTQRWAHKSGFNLNYTYQRPEGGTPFRFDQQGQYHALNADIGFLDDRRFQLTARVGYDFTQLSSNYYNQPWQTLSANMLYRPVGWARFRNLFSFDPNSGKLVSITNDWRFRGSNQFSLDLVSKYDPSLHKFGSMNSYLNLPIGADWRIVALLQYNGYLGRFESRNLQITRDLHCLEASLTYMDNPSASSQYTQIYFMLRIKAFPYFQRFGVGQNGQAIDTSVGESY